MLIIKVIAIVILAWLLIRIVGLCVQYKEYLRLKQQGVVFQQGNSFSPIGNMRVMMQYIKKYPSQINFRKMFEDEFGPKMPHIIGRIFLGQASVVFTNVEQLQDLYINKNQTTTKAKHVRNNFSHLIPQSILLQPSEDVDYPEKRKALSGAFFKSKMLGMTKIIKEVTLQEIAKFQAFPTIDIAAMTTQLQAAIITNVSVGKGSSGIKIDIEKEDGSIVQSPLADSISLLVGQSIAKQFNANNILFPRLIKLCYTPWERRYARNCVRLRAAILSIINKRRKGESKTYDDQADLLSILLSTDFYKNEDELMIDEVITFFLAGMKTIQISTTNLIYHLAKNPAIKARLLKEILPCVEKAMGNIVEDMTYESVMDFTYLQQCYYESLRLEPPVQVSFFQSMTQDTVVSGVTIKKGSLYSILFDAIHHDPEQWIEHMKYEPDRFDTTKTDNRWLLAANGKPRNPLSFTPFMGGKRVCLGKTFAEVTTRFTVPLLFHFCDFEFIDPAQALHKEQYGAGNQDLQLPMKLIIRNRVIE